MYNARTGFGVGDAGFRVGEAGWGVEEAACATSCIRVRSRCRICCMRGAGAARCRCRWTVLEDALQVLSNSWLAMSVRSWNGEQGTAVVVSSPILAS